MKKTKKRSKLTLRILCIILISIGVAAFCALQFWLIPICERNDPMLHKNFSKIGYWEYIQNYVKHYGWTHDDCFPVGNYGDKKWAEWIINKAAQGEKLAGCFNVGHKDSALQHITNQDPTNGKNCDESKKWVEWWGANKNKNQLQWIQDGFLKYGVKVTFPAKSDEYKPLLEILGKRKVENNYEMAFFPDYLRYNAFRWLRDSGFNPLDYALKVVNKNSSKEEINGLYEYQQQYKLTPHEDCVGLLPLLCENKTYYPYDYYGESRPRFYDPKVKLIVYSIIFLPMIIGISLLWSTRKKKEAE